MKRLLFVVLFLLQTFFCTLRAQQHFYLFLQSESGQSYYARVHQKRYLSNQAGEVTIPGFSSGDYILRIGWGHPAHPELAFPLHFQDNDLGLQLKQKTDSSWELYDPGRRVWIAALDSTGVGLAADSIEIRQVKTEDGFALLLANVVNDSSMLYRTVEKKGSWPAAAPPVVQRTELSVPDSGQAETQSLREPLPAPERSAVVVQAISPAGNHPVSDTLQSAGGRAPLGVDSGSALIEKDPAADVIAVRQQPADSAGTARASGVVSQAADSTRSGAGNPAAALPSSGEANAAADSLPSVTLAADSLRQRPALPAEVTADSLLTGPEASDKVDSSRKRSDSTRTLNSLAERAKEPEGAGTSVAAAPVGRQGAVRKLMENDFKGGKQLVYESLEPGGMKDTVSITIDENNEPSGQQIIGQPDRSVVPSTDSVRSRPQPRPSAPTPPPAASRDSSVVEARALMGPGRPEADRSGSEGKAVLKQAPGTDTLAMINSDCTQFASEQDVDKLRISLLKAAGTDERIQIAGRVFRTRCFATRQIRALSELFPDDAGKFRFFDLAYPHVSDTDHFRQLIDLFTGEEYARRFRVLLHMN